MTMNMRVKSAALLRKEAEAQLQAGDSNQGHDLSMASRGLKSYQRDMNIGGDGSTLLDRHRKSALPARPTSNARAQNWVEHCLRCGYYCILGEQAQGNCKHCYKKNEPDGPAAMRAAASGWYARNRAEHWKLHKSQQDQRTTQKTPTPKAEAINPISNRAFFGGVWDSLHIGTITSIGNMTRKCNSLVLGVFSDFSVVQANQLAPLFTLEERRRLLSSIRGVDRVIFNVPFEPLASSLNDLKCDYLFVQEKAGDAKNGDNAVIVHPFTKGVARFVDQLKQTDNLGAVCDKYVTLVQGGKIREANEVQNDRCDSLVLIHLLRIAIKYSNLVCKNTPIEKFFQNATDDFPLPSVWARLRRKDTWQGPLISSNLIQPLPSSEEEAHTVEEAEVPSLDQERTVYLDGAFDIFHPAHLDLIEAGRKYFHASRVVVGILSDEAIFKTTGELPCFTMLERASVVRSIRGVDEVIFDVPWIVRADMLRQFRVDVVLQRLELYPSCGYGFEVKYLRSESIYRAAMHEYVIPVEKCHITLTTNELLLRVLTQYDAILATFSDYEKNISGVRNTPLQRIAEILDVMRDDGENRPNLMKSVLKDGVGPD